MSTLCEHMLAARSPQSRPGSHDPDLPGCQAKNRTACQLPMHLPARHLVCHTAPAQSALWSIVLMASCCRRAGQHPPNLQKIYPAQAKRVRKAPQRYSGGQVLPPLHISHSEEHRPAQTHSHSGLASVPQHLMKQTKHSFKYSIGTHCVCNLSCETLTQILELSSFCAP